MSYFCQPLSVFLYTLPSAPAYTSPPEVFTAPALLPPAPDTPAPLAPLDDENEPALPYALLWLCVCTVWLGPEIVVEPQRPYALLFCCVEPVRPVLALYQLALPDAPSGPHTALPCA